MLQDNRKRGPTVVITADAFYDNVPPEDVELATYKMAVEAPVFVVNSRYPIGTFVVPAKFMLDISGIEMAISYFVGGLAARLSNHAVARLLYFEVRINGRTPWRVQTDDADAIAPYLRSGLDYLNTNLMGLWGDPPGHLMVKGGDRVELAALTTSGNLPTLPPDAYLEGMFSGRLIPLTTYERLMKRYRT